VERWRDFVVRYIPMRRQDVVLITALYAAILVLVLVRLWGHGGWGVSVSDGAGGPRYGMHSGTTGGTGRYRPRPYSAGPGTSTGASTSGDGGRGPAYAGGWVVGAGPFVSFNLPLSIALTVAANALFLLWQRRQGPPARR
jgi:hypothetical protein